MKVFIDDFNLIRVESGDYIDHIHIDGYEIFWLKNENNFQYFQTNKDLLLHICDHIYINNQRYALNIGLVTLLDKFDQKFRYQGSLGSLYTKEETSFKVFSPVCKEMYVVVDEEEYKMTYKMPIWHVTVKGDLELKNYHYKVRLVDEFKNVNDPYAKGANLQGPVIIDENKYVVKKDLFKQINLLNKTFIYEAHVRNLTSSLNIIHQGTFSALTLKVSSLNNSSVLDYIKNLGMTHLQLLPVFDFEGVDDVNKDAYYNWGYNPSNYFIFDGWYSINPNDPYERIDSFVKMIEYAHQINLKVNLDVVFNHVYQHTTFPYDFLVPGYFYRHDQNNKMTDSSFCGNDVETRRYMVRKLIIDNLIYFTKNFKIDGFRFDLMGLLDIKLMKEIQKSLVNINPNILLYGEGWNMPTVVDVANQSNMNNAHKMAGFGFFNDEYRNYFRGNLYTDDAGFLINMTNDEKKLNELLNGSPHKFGRKSYSINYLECHDNKTLYDRLYVNTKDHEKNLFFHDLANHLLVLSKGVCFIHHGQEFYKSKYGHDNSYNAGDVINQIIYHLDLPQLKRFKKIIDYKKANHINDYYQYRFKKTNNLYIDKNDQYYHIIKNDFLLNKITLKDFKMIFSSQKIRRYKDQVYLNKPGVYLFKRK